MNMLNTENKKYNVIVAGGGLTGAAAAMAAAREGAKVLLIERNGSLGGAATAALVNPFMSYYTRSDHQKGIEKEQVNKGIFEEILQEMFTLDGGYMNQVHCGCFNEEILKIALDRMAKRYGVNVLFHSEIISADCEEGKVNRIRVYNKSGINDYEADYFIDATGDANLCWLSNCDYEVGRKEDGLCQPMTLNFRVSQVDTNKLSENGIIAQIIDKWNELKDKGLIKNPREDLLIFPNVNDGVVHINATRIIKKSPLDAQDYSDSEVLAREQVYEIYRFLKENAPGFENCKILMSASEVGIRESRRIIGEYVIQVEELLSCVKFEDSIVRGTYPVDIHNPSGTGTVIKNIPANQYYTIPYRALIPKGFKNLLVCGRCISSTHEAQSAYRIMPICCCMGEGAGVAVGLCVKHKIDCKQVSINEMHTRMDECGALY